MQQRSIRFDEALWIRCEALAQRYGAEGAGPFVREAARLVAAALDGGEHGMDPVVQALSEDLALHAPDALGRVAEVERLQAEAKAAIDRLARAATPARPAKPTPPVEADCQACGEASRKPRRARGGGRTRRTTSERRAIPKRQVESGEACPPCPPGFATSEEERRHDVVITPQRPQGERIHYEVRSAESLIASHKPSDFGPDERYPENVQERQYHADVSEQMKVVQGAQGLRPELVLARTSSPLDGPPLVTEDGEPLVLGGNGRSLMLKRAYALELPAADSYRAELVRRAEEWGIKPESVEATPHPVLVRVVEGLRRDAPREALVAAVRRYNEALTQAMDPIAQAVAQARVLSEQSVQDLGGLLADSDASLRELMASRPEAFREALARDGILTPQNRSRWVTDSGTLTDEAKDLIEGMFLGRVLGSADRIRATAASLLRKVERAVPWLVAVEAKLKGTAFDLTPAVQQAVDLLNDTAARNLTLDELLAQGNLFGGPAPEETARRVAALLSHAGQREVGQRFARWARTAIHDPAQGYLFGGPPTTENALQALLN